MSGEVLFTVDWESWFNATEPKEKWNDLETLVKEPTIYLLNQLDKYRVRAIFYVLGWLRDKEPKLYEEIKTRGHIIGSHGYWHGHNEKEEGLFRSPYWDTTPLPGICGGFFLRILPYRL